VTAVLKEAGFSLVEMLIAVAVAVTTFGLLFQAAARGQRIARAQPEAADVQQRVRVATDMLRRDLLAAGSGPTHGVGTGPLDQYFPPVVPARTGARNFDPELTFFTDRISIVAVPEGGVAARLSSNMAGVASDLPIDSMTPGCASWGLCGFTPGTRSAIFDRAGIGAGVEWFSVTGIAAGLAHDVPNPPFSRAYSAPTARVVPIVQHVYYLDRVNARLMLYDGYQSDVPLVENIVDLRFAYFLAPSPSSVTRPTDGETNCAYAAGTPPVPLLADLGGIAPQLAAASLLTDGPPCGLPPHRFDADLLRVRRVRVTIRAQAGLDDLRGVSRDFSRRGRSIGAESSVPDVEVTFDVSLRNVGSGS
jgi:type II secretory pathway pseudopilin PulG